MKFNEYITEGKDLIRKIDEMIKSFKSIRTVVKKHDKNITDVTMNIGIPNEDFDEDTAEGFEGREDQDDLYRTADDISSHISEAEMNIDDAILGLEQLKKKL